MKKYFTLFSNFLLSITLILLLSSCSYIATKVINLNDLPNPKGPYSVGSRIYTWIDQTRHESFTEDSFDKRKIVVQVWYPISKRDIKKMNYIDRPDKRIQPIAEQFVSRDVSPSFISFLMSDVKNIKTNSEYNADIEVNSLEKYPLIVFSHGLGGMKNQNSIQVEELVSQGYIVIAPDHSYDANITIFEDNQIAPFKSAEYDPEITYSIDDFYKYRIPQINTRSADLSFIIDKIEEFQRISSNSVWDLIDLDNIGVFGHSFGGGTSFLTIYRDKRFDAGIALDGWIEPVPNEVINNGIQKPFLYIGQIEWQDTLNYYKLDNLIDNSGLNGQRVLLPGTKHFDYTDTPYFHNVTKRMKISGSMPTQTIVDTLNYHLINFFDKYLKEN